MLKPNSVFNAQIAAIGCRAITARTKTRRTTFDMLHLDVVNVRAAAISASNNFVAVDQAVIKVVCGLNLTSNVPLPIEPVTHSAEFVEFV